MKNAILIAFLLTFGITEPIFGQMGLSFSAGVNNSNCTFKKFEETTPKARFGYFFGVAPSYQISKKMLFQVDVQYSLRGYDIDNENNPTVSGVRYRYLDIIPEVEFSIHKYLALGFGANYGIKLNEQFKTNENGNWSTVSDGLEVIKSTDFGLTGKIKANYKNIFGFVRYNLGLKNISDLTFTDSNGQNIEDAKQLNRNLQIGVGYTFNLRKN